MNRITMNKIKYYRMLANMSQTELAGKIGVTQITISKIETNKANISLNTAKKICEVFDKTLDELFS